ncbi:MAG: RDD family protein [Dehalococcoidia bacterium]
MGQFGDDGRGEIFCTQCRLLLAAGTRYCTRCGTPARGEGTVALDAGIFLLAGFGRRLAGHLIDSTLLAIPVLVIVTSVIAASYSSDCTTTRAECLRDDLRQISSPAALLVSQVIPLAYWAVWDSFGTSPGRWAVGIRITTRTGERPGFRRGCVRTLVSQLASGRVLYVGYLWALWDRDRRTWHDHAARTWAVRR